MHFHNFALTFIIYTLSFSTKMKYSNANSSEIASEFSLNEPDIEFNNLAVDKNGGWVYVGGSNNHLYQLSADLKSQINYTSMDFDSSDCTRDNCWYASNDNWINCRSSLLELDYRNQQLIACHSCYRNSILPGVCRAHKIRNISEILANPTEYASSGTQTVSFIAPTSIQNWSALYCGINFRDGATPKITIRHLDHGRFLSYDKEMTVNSYSYQYSIYESKFIYGFNSENSSYFLTEGMSVSQKVINSDFSVEVNLIEIRHEGQNYRFDDVLLTCGTDGQTLINESVKNRITLQHAYFYEHKPDSELKTDSHAIEGKILFTVTDVFDFSTHRKTSFKVCAYNMSNIHSIIQKRRVLHGEIIYDHISNINVTSVAVISINSHIVLFIGTDTGHLQKISIRLDSSRAYTYTANIYADITIDEGFPINSNMLFDSRKKYLYVMTERKLAKIQIHNCDEYNTPYACLDAKDPYCGWCFLRNRCCLKSECNDKPNSIEWISYEIDKYVNKSSHPRNKFSRTAEWNVTFDLLNSHPFNNHTILCSFRFNNTIINTTTRVRNRNIINCVRPSYKDLPRTPANEHSIKAQLSVQTNIFPEFQNIEVEFFDCSTYKLCTECVYSTPCNWHINEQKCSDEEIRSSDDDTIRGYDFNVSHFPQLLELPLGYNCPVFFGIHRYKRLYRHANTGKKENISAVLTIPKILINETFTCKFDTEENTTIISVSRQNTFRKLERNVYDGQIECDDTIFTYDTPKSSITVKWSILWNGSKPLENFRNDVIVLYKCANMGDRCENCLDRNYKCMWNSKTGECKYNSLDVLMQADINNHWLNDIENCLMPSAVPTVITKSQTNCLTGNIYWIIIIIMIVAIKT